MYIARARGAQEVNGFRNLLHMRHSASWCKAIDCCWQLGLPLEIIRHHLESNNVKRVILWFTAILGDSQEYQPRTVVSNSRGHLSSQAQPL